MEHAILYLDTLARMIGYGLLAASGSLAAVLACVALGSLAFWAVSSLLDEVNDWLREESKLPEDREWDEAGVRENAAKE